MLLQQFAILNNAFTYANEEKNNHTDIYVYHGKFHYNVISGNRVKIFQNIVYYFYQGNLQLNRSSEFPWKIFQYENGTHT